MLHDKASEEIFNIIKRIELPILKINLNYVHLFLKKKTLTKFVFYCTITKHVQINSYFTRYIEHKNIFDFCSFNKCFQYC